MNTQTNVRVTDAYKAVTQILDDMYEEGKGTLDQMYDIDINELIERSTLKCNDQQAVRYVVKRFDKLGHLATD